MAHGLATLYTWARLPQQPAHYATLPLHASRPTHRPVARLTILYCTGTLYYYHIFGCVDELSGRNQPNGFKILSISMRKVWTCSLAQKHGFEEICRPNDGINVAYCNALFMYKTLTMFNNLLSIGNFVTKIILGLLKYYRMCR